MVRSGDSYYRWKQGEFGSEGGLAAVKETVRRLGAVESCEFVKGFYSETLPELDSESIVFVFEDADLPSSVRDCLIHLWPKMQYGSYFYSHEPWSVPVVSLFYDAALWRDELGEEPPGFVGAGNEDTLPSGLFQGLGFALKIDQEEVLSKGRRVVIPGSI